MNGLTNDSMEPGKFDDIRPYEDFEIPAAMHRIAENPALPAIARHLYPGRNPEEVKNLIRNITCTDELQRTLMFDIIKSVLSSSVCSFTYSGIENIRPEGSYLFVSNHRDIVLDAFLFSYVLWSNGFETPEVTFGANLMSGEFLTDLGKSNKMFRVERPGLSVSSPRDFYLSSLRLSEYIRYVITGKHRSVWIAQRNGRTKDGRDLTDQGIVKMFGMSCPEDKVKSLSELSIVPLSISYEWEPCDILKTLELYESGRHAYVKKPGEDLNSIITGLTEQKGSVHINICSPLGTEDYEPLSSLSASRFSKEVARAMDRRICGSYRLTQNNFIACDLRGGTDRYSDRYTARQKEKFLERLQGLEKFETYDSEELKRIFLGIYANPVISYNETNE